MKKLIFIVLLCWIQTASYGGNFRTPVYQNRLVNDYIGLMEESKKEILEKQLRDFEQKSSIEIVVVILDDLNGIEPQQAATQIGQDWGVGKKELDNGIVFLVVKYNQSALEKLFSSKNGDVYIATGYGMEPYLTDGKAGQLLEDHFIPLVKKGKYTEATIATVQAIINKLGTDSWQQREELKAIREAKKKENQKKVMYGALSLLVIILLGGFIIWLCNCIKRWWKRLKQKRRLKRALQEAFQTIEQKEKSFLQKLSEKEINVKTYPTWAQGEYNREVNDIKRSLQEVYAKKNTITEQIKTGLLDQSERDIVKLKDVNPVNRWTEKVEWIEKEIIRYNKAKNALKESFLTIEEKEKEFLKKVSEKENSIKEYPNWAKSEYNQTVDTIKKNLQNTYVSKENINEKINSNSLNEAERDIDKLKRVNPMEKWSDKIKEIETLIAQYKREAPEKVQSCENSLTGFKSKIDKLQREGFTVDTFGRSHQEFLGLLGGIKIMIAKKNQEKEVIEHSNLLIQKIADTRYDLLGLSRMKSENDESIHHLKKLVEGVDQKQTNAESKLKELMNYPQEQWETIRNNLATVVQLKATLSQKIAEAQQKNDMNNQKFGDAKQILKGALTTLNYINEYCEAPQQKLEEIARIKAECEKLLKSIPNDISKANNKIREGGSDIENSTKLNLRNTENKFEEGKRLCSTNPINWIIILALLKEVSQNAQNAYRKAENDMQEAANRRRKEEEERRRRQREEEERRKRQREEEERRRRSYSSSSSFGGTSFGSSSGGGFRTGGGGFGGGGAGRSW